MTTLRAWRSIRRCAGPSEATDAWRKLENAVDVTGAKARSEVAAAIAADLAEQAENAIVVSPAAEPAEQPADVIEPDDCDGELV
jgi:hypothetical protein